MTFCWYNGRGVKVVAECVIRQEVLKRIRRTTAEDMLAFLGPSIELAQKEEMIGYNLNIANAIAAIFVATAQDLASIHESSVGFLNLSLVKDGLDEIGAWASSIGGVVKLIEADKALVWEGIEVIK